MMISDYMDAVIADLKANAKFFKDVGTHGKVFGLSELRDLVLYAPAVRIALVGARGSSSSTGARRDSMGRDCSGRFRGPLQMIGFLIEQDWKGEEARDRVIKLSDQFMYFLEHRTFGLSNEDAGPALITGFDIFYSAEIDAEGAAVAAVTWEQEVVFGRNLHDEDMALLTGDKFDQYPSGQEFFPEKEWADLGQLNPNTPPIVEGSATPEFYGETEPDPSDDDE